MHKLLSQIESPLDLRKFSISELYQLADEMRDALCKIVSIRSAHFASNLGVVELCLALHSTFDFRRDRLIWDTGHQIYPHKLITGRYHEFSTIRTKGGLMGYPNPRESEYDLFMTGHAGCSIATMLGLHTGDQVLGEADRHAVAVIGDGAFPSGIVYEAMNNTGKRRKFLVVLNDNKMSICPRVGGMADYLDRLRTNPYYTGLKTEVVKILNKVPVFGDSVERFLAQLKEGVKAGMHGGMLFEDLGFRYIGPIDGHDIAILRKYLDMVKDFEEPVLLHVVTEKGHGFQPAAEDPVYFHTPPAFVHENGKAIPNKSQASNKVYTHYARDAILDQMRANSHVTVMTAAMCQGNKLEPVREEFPDRFFDTGICESHTVAFAAGQAKAGAQPIVDIYSTFLQRSYDQLFQEVALQNLPVTFMLDRAGLTGPDGPTHHGMFDIGYMRLLPNMIVMAPGEGREVALMLEFALQQNSPCSMRYPKTSAETVAGQRTPIELGRAELLRWGQDGMIIVCGTLLANCVQASDALRDKGLDVGVINARFVKPLDKDLIVRAIRKCPFVITVEESALQGGFGSAVLELAADEGINASHVRRLGIPDQFIEHGDRGELLTDLGLDSVSIARIATQLTDRGETIKTVDVR